MGTCMINGRVYKNFNGVVTVENDKILVNGKPLEDWHESDEKTINITIEGNVEALDVTNCSTININGDAKKVKTGHGDVKIGGNVGGDIKTRPRTFPQRMSPNPVETSPSTLPHSISP